MTAFKKYNLDFQKSLEYFRSNLEKTNALSDMIMRFVKFNLGQFFTILPEGLHEEIHKFKTGGIAIGVRLDFSYSKN